MSACRSCGAPIVWATTSKGKKMPLDEEPVKLPGLFTLVDGKAVAPPALHQSHFASCPNAAAHRRGRPWLQRGDEVRLIETGVVYVVDSFKRITEHSMGDRSRPLDLIVGVDSYGTKTLLRGDLVEKVTG